MLGALLLLADGRLPVGGHVHSGGMEAAMADGRVEGVADVEAFVIGRLHTTGLMEATIVAATVVRLSGRAGTDVIETLRAIDREADARFPAPPMRSASRRLGRQLHRVASRCWPHPLLVDVTAVHAEGVHQAVALGAVAVVTEVSPRDAAAISLHHALSTPAQAAVKLGGLDPFEVAACQARLAPLVDELADGAERLAHSPLAELPSTSGPAVDIAAVGHAAQPSRLFAT